MTPRLLITSKHPYARNVIANELRWAGLDVTLMNVQDVKPAAIEPYDLVLTGPQPHTIANALTATLLCWNEIAPVGRDTVISVDQSMDGIIYAIEVLCGARAPDVPVKGEWTRAKQRAARRPVFGAIGGKLVETLAIPSAEPPEKMKGLIEKLFG